MNKVEKARTRYGIGGISTANDKDRVLRVQTPIKSQLWAPRFYQGFYFLPMSYHFVFKADWGVTVSKQYRNSNKEY